MKRILICLILVLCTLVGCAGTPDTWESTQPTELSTTQATTETTEEPTTEPTTVSEAEPDEIDTYNSYYDVIRERRELLADADGEGFLTDIDNDGVNELAVMYTAEEGENSLLLCDLYTMQDEVVVPLLEKHIVYYNNAGGPTGYIGVAENDGSRYFVVKTSYADWKDGCHESIGAWELYTLSGTALSLEAELSFDYLLSNESIDSAGIWITDKPSYLTEEILPDASTFSMNGAPMTAEQYALWLDNTIFMESIDGFTWDGEQNSLEMLQAYCSLELFMQASDAPDELWYQWHNFMGISDSVAWTAREWVVGSDGVRMELGVLHENPMNRGTGIDSAETLAEKISVQYRYWEETGELDYIHVDKDTPPYYQVTTLAINASSLYAEVQILINGVDFGTHTLDHRVLLLPVDSEPIVAKEPAVVELRLISGELPDALDVFVCMESNISGAR